VKPFSSMPVAGRKPGSVLLLTVDALRPWRGYPRAIAPNLAKLAAESVEYTHAYALSSYTSMSLGGLMAGKYPSELVRDGRATSSFGDENLMLAEVLKAAGVRTIGVHGHVYFAGQTGIAQGFDDWRVVRKITSRPAREGHVVDDELADLLMSALREHGEKHAHERFFAWAHFMDPHFRYVKHAGIDYRGASDPALSETGQGLRNAYDGEVTFTDAQIGRVLAFLREQPWAKDTAVIVTADHGEAFGEHKSYYEHGNFLWDVVTRVPLLLKVPGVEPRKIDVRRSHIDLARTVLELAGVAPPDSFRGTSLLPELRGEPAAERDLVIDMPYTDQTPRRRALIHGKHKLVVTETEERPELYDLDADPGEQRNLERERPELVRELEALWDKTNAALPDYPAERRGTRQY
jgi:arylsulfatase A-like enzyme